MQGVHLAPTKVQSIGSKMNPRGDFQVNVVFRIISFVNVIFSTELCQMLFLTFPSTVVTEAVELPEIQFLGCQIRIRQAPLSFFQQLGKKKSFGKSHKEHPFWLELIS